MTEPASLLIATAEPVNLPPPVSDSRPAPKGPIRIESNFHPVTAAALLAETPEPMVWIWESYLPKGALVLLVAYMKVGKSTLAYPLALAVAQGRPFLGYATTQTPVLLLAVEEHPRDVRQRLERFGLRKDDAVHVHRGRLTPSDRVDIERYIREHGIGLVLLDTLSRYWQIKDENDNAQVMERISPFIDLAHETGATIVLVHHESKAGGAGGRGIRGGSALLAAVDQALMLEKRKGHAQARRRILRAIGRYDETPDELVIELADGEYRRVGTLVEASRGADTETVLAALSDAPCRPETIATTTGLSLRRVRAALAALGGDPAKVRRQGTGRRGNPFTYCRPAPDSIQSGADPMGPESNGNGPAPDESGR